MTDDSNVTRLPEPGVVLDLDSLERDPKDIKPPFVVKIGDRKVTFNDPTEVDWQDLAAVEVPADLIRVALSREDRIYVHGLDMPTWKFGKLMEAYSTHYDLEEKLRAARRQQAFGGL